MSQERFDAESTEEFLVLWSARITEFVFRRFRDQGIQFAEDIAQDALLRALQVWPISGLPDEPEAWLVTTAKRLALNAVKQKGMVGEKASAMFGEREVWGSSDGFDADLEAEREFEDSALRLMFVCCHPEVPWEGQAALVLKTLSGMTVSQIAAAFFEPSGTVERRLSRAREKLAKLNLNWDKEDTVEFERRLDSVASIVYLTFSEGYKASEGTDLIRPDLCAEALRLGRLILDSKSGRKPVVHALMALMLFHTARFSSRTSALGELVTLRFQDRSKWDRGLIAEGLSHLEKSAQGGRLTRFHLEATIAGLHATSPSFEETDWRRILECYDLLLAIVDSPVMRLNRAVAVAEIEGGEAGLRALEGLEESNLAGYHLFHAVRAEFAERSGDAKSAQAWRARAHMLARVEAEKVFLKRSSG